MRKFVFVITRTTRIQCGEVLNQCYIYTDMPSWTEGKPHHPHMRITSMYLLCLYNTNSSGISNVQQACMERHTAIVYPQIKSGETSTATCMLGCTCSCLLCCDQLTKQAAAHRFPIIYSKVHNQFVRIWLLLIFGRSPPPNTWVARCGADCSPFL